MLVATKQGNVVVLTPAELPVQSGASTLPKPVDDLGQVVHAALNNLRPRRAWRVAIGRPHSGAYGIARSYEEARDGLNMSARMHLDNPIVNADNLLIYRVLLRDQPAILDLVHAVLSPLSQARGGAEPLVDTLDAYFATGGVATETAERLGLSVRAVTYRLDRITTLTGHNPANPAHQFTLQAAVLGARLLGWPERELPRADTSP